MLKSTKRYIHYLENHSVQSDSMIAALEATIAWQKTQIVWLREAIDGENEVIIGDLIIAPAMRRGKKNKRIPANVRWVPDSMDLGADEEDHESAGSVTPWVPAEAKARWIIVGMIVGSAVSVVSGFVTWVLVA